MTKEIPLSLQVFHSLNEYKARRKNRTEDLRLRDVEDGLTREKNLYAKDFALHKQKFHAHYARRFSDPVAGTASSCRSTPTSLSRASVFSAPASLRHLSASSSLTSRLCESISEISTSSRFQRIQRKFSIASFTENGLLTAKGSNLASNISKARQVLFNRGKWNPKSPTETQPETPLLPVVEDDDEEENDEEHAGISKSTRNASPDSAHITKVAERNTDNVNDEEVKITNENHDNINGQVRAPLLKLRAMRNFSPKKRVSIQLPEEVETIQEEAQNEGDDAILNDSRRESLQNPRGSDSAFDWKSIFSRPITAARLDPLQVRIKQFLSEQSDFNKHFPKGPTDQVTVDGVHMEMVKKRKKKQEQEIKERKRKQEMIMEVLTILDIKDEHTLLHYNELHSKVN